MDEQLFAAVDRYIDALFLSHDEALDAALQAAQAANLPNVHVSPNQGRLLLVLALLCQARRILEIGTLAGYSTIWMARALPADGRLITLDAEPTHAEIARANIARAGLADRIEVRVGIALELLPQLEREGAAPFDMIFIDADKPPYPDYLAWALRLSRPGTLIIADNVIRSGAVLDTNSQDAGLQAIQHFNAALAADPRVTATIVPSVGIKGYDGLAIAVVRE
jgi:caffeoyl-CoA O-methyltransferase